MNRIKLPQSELLRTANKKLQNTSGFIKGMEFESAELVDGNLLLRGSLMLDEKLGIEVQRVYNDFIEVFSQKYSLAV